MLKKIKLVVIVVMSMVMACSNISVSAATKKQKVQELTYNNIKSVNKWGDGSSKTIKYFEKMQGKLYVKQDKKVKIKDVWGPLYEVLNWKSKKKSGYAVDYRIMKLKIDHRAKGTPEQKWSQIFKYVRNYDIINWDGMLKINDETAQKGIGNSNKGYCTYTSFYLVDEKGNFFDFSDLENSKRAKEFFKTKGNKKLCKLSACMNEYNQRLNIYTIDLKVI